MAAVIGSVATSVDQVIEGAAEALESYGTVRFTTDPMAPSGIDLLFSPRSGPHAGCVYLVDYKATGMDHYLPSAVIASSRSKVEGLHEVFPGSKVHVVVSTDGYIGNAGIRLAGSADVKLIPGVRSGGELAERVAGLAGLAV